MSNKNLRNVLSKFATGVTIVSTIDDDGKPIGVWEETDPRDKNNLIITTYSDEGKVISVSKKTITYSSK